MNIQTILNSSLGVGTSLVLGQIIPERIAYRFVNYVSRQVVSRPERIMVRATRANQWVIAGENISPEELDRRTFGVFCSIGRSLFDFYHNLHHPQKIKDLVIFSPHFQQVFQERLEGKQGAIFISTHTSAFDLGGAALALNGLHFQTLSDLADDLIFFRDFLPDGCAKAVHVYFPDPWPKKRHHKHRIMQEAFLDQVRRISVPNALFFFGTDHEEYNLETQELFRRTPWLEMVDANAEPTEGIQTNFEIKYRKIGKPIYRCVLKVRPR